MTKARFAMVPLDTITRATEARLSGVGWGVLTTILSFRNHKTRYAFPGIGLLEKRTGYSRTSVKRSIRELGTLGILEIAYIPGLGNRYWIPGEMPETIYHCRIHSPQ